MTILLTLIVLLSGTASASYDDAAQNTQQQRRVYAQSAQMFVRSAIKEHQSHGQLITDPIEWEKLQKAIEILSTKAQKTSSVAVTIDCVKDVLENSLTINPKNGCQVLSDVGQYLGAKLLHTVLILRTNFQEIPSNSLQDFIKLVAKKNNISEAKLSRFLLNHEAIINAILAIDNKLPANWLTHPTARKLAIAAHVATSLLTPQ